MLATREQKLSMTHPEGKQAKVCIKKSNMIGTVSGAEDSTMVRVRSSYKKFKVDSLSLRREISMHMRLEHVENNIVRWMCNATVKNDKMID